jgi:hypothetical protein
MSFFDTATAEFSACGKYRYRLDRALPYKGPTLSITMVNPSTAGREANDPTIRKVLGFARDMHVGHVIVTNQFAFVSTDVRALKHVPDPIGPLNDRFIREAALEAQIHVVAWGPLAKLPEELHYRWRAVTRLIRKAGGTPKCWGTAMDGQPRHPLMLAYSTPLVAWSEP